MIKLNLFTQPRRKVMVVSHERSGTHFLMNSIAKCFGYISDPWVNYDSSSVATNFHSCRAVQEFFEQFRGHPVANIVKSHHPFVFFETTLEEITKEFSIFYVYRDPRDVMVSLWRYIQQVRWHEGPRTDSVKEFIRRAPEANLLRYQRRQEPTMIHRWKTHVDSWMLNLPEKFRPHVTYVCFRDLRDNYEAVIRSIASVLGPSATIEKPTLDERSVFPGKGLVGGYRDHLDAEDLELFREIAGPTMDRLGYGPEPTAGVTFAAPARVEIPA
jgi:hypothetical protein